MPRRSRLHHPGLRISMIGCFVSASLFAQSPSFTEEALDRGIDYVTVHADWRGAHGCGISLNDLDGDGDLDLLTTGRLDGRPGVFLNDGAGGFRDVTETVALPASVGLSGVSLADYDGDGDLDIYFSAWWEPNRLLRNEGGLRFRDVTMEALPALGDSGPGEGSCWGDFDGDGWLDLYLCNWRGDSPNRLYRNEGDGTFSERSTWFGADDLGASFQAAWFDSDLDGDLDLYLSNDKGDAARRRWNRLFRNDTGTLVEISVGSGANIAINSMGVATGDLNGDGLPDLYCTNTPSGNRLLVNQGGNTFIDETARFGLGAFTTGWSTHIVDLDNDGSPEVFVANSTSSNQLFGCAQEPCVPIGPEGLVGLPGASYCSAVGDVDGDGDLDLIVQTHGEPIRLYINQAGQSRSWLTVRLAGEYPNLMAIGARVRVEAGGRTLEQQLLAGVGFKSSSTFDLHFGLGDSEVADAVVVTWPGGARTSTLVDVRARQLLVIAPGVGFSDCDGNSLDDAEELRARTARDVDGNGVLDDCQPRFVRADCDGDARLEISDAICTLVRLFGSGQTDCLESLDANDDGRADISDAIHTLGWLFLGSGSMSAPFPRCGVDPTPDALGCEQSSAACR